MKTTIINSTCPICHKTDHIEVSQEALNNYYYKGQTVQKAFPNLNADIREQIMTGIDKKCWAELMSDEDE